MDSKNIDEGDTVSYEPETPRLCANGCGFFGTSATHNLGSKCYRDFLLAKSAAYLASIEKPPLNPSLAISSDFLASESSESRTGNSNGGASVSSSSSSTTVKNRCQLCRKKVGLTGFQCRCDGIFCGMHRYPEEHSCTFDYQADGRIALMKDNPTINGDKLQKRIE